MQTTTVYFTIPCFYKYIQYTYNFIYTAISMEKEKAILSFPEILRRNYAVNGILCDPMLLQCYNGTMYFSVWVLIYIFCSYSNRLYGLLYAFNIISHFYPTHDNCLQAIKPQFNLISTILIQLYILQLKWTHFIELKKWLVFVLFKLV